MANKDIRITFTIDGIDKEVRSVEELTQELDKLGKSAKKTGKETKKLASEQGFIAEKVGQLKSTFAGLKGDFKNATAGIKTFFKSGVTGSKLLKLGLASIGIGLIITAVTSLIAYFQNFEVVTRTVQKALNALGAIFSQLGKAFAALISGDFKGMKNAFKDIGSAVTEAVTATDALFDSAKRLNEIQKKNVIQNARLRQEIEGYKKILEDTTALEEDRLAALDEVTKRTKQLAKAQLEENAAAIAGLEAKIKLENNEVARRDLELELAQLRAERIDQQTELNNIEFDAAKVGREIRQQQLDEEQAILDKKNEQKLAQDAIDKAEADKKKEEEIQRATDLKAKLQELEEEAIVALAENEFRKAEIILNQEQEKAIAELDALGATEEQKQVIYDKYAKKRTTLAKSEAKFKKQLSKEEKTAALNTAKSAFDVIGKLAGEGSAIGKASAIASASINTYQAATNALANTPGPPPIPQIAAGVAIASGLLNVKQILSTKLPNGATEKGSTSLPAAPPIPTFDPSAALEGGSFDPSVENQVTLGDQTGSNGTIVKAYVVSDDMTTQQEADAKINDLARL